MKDWCLNSIGALMVIAGLAQSHPALSAAPTAEVAKRCLRYAYTVYPFQRPGAAPMSGDRQAYFKDCLAKNGDVPVPARPNRSATAEKAIPSPPKDKD